MFRILTQFKILKAGFFTSLTFSLLFLMGCHSDERQVDIGFYHWKTKVEIDSTEYHYMQALGARQLYLRLFDVVWGATGPSFTPMAQLQSPLPSAWRIVPVIFITNRCILNANDAQIADLAKDLTQEIQKTRVKNNWKLDEVQLDCDWSLTSKAKYFALLRAIKAESNWKISATIRLHQVKYAEKTGIPPVDRGLLMFYNMGDLQKSETRNSILDLDVAKKYLYNFESYSLPLDVALPLFSWAVQLRYGRPVHLIEGPRRADLKDSTVYEVLEYPHYRVLKNHYLKGSYLYKGDELRLEEVSDSALEAAAQLLAPELPTRDSLKVLFYHLDSSLIKNYHHEALHRFVEYFE